jgi:alpha-L-arabinofuranosidase
VVNCRKLIAENAPGRDIRLGITEWNTTAGAWQLGRAMLWTLDNALACSRYHNLMHRNCDIMEIANRSNLVDSFCSGIIQPNNHTLFKTPTYYIQELYANHAGQRPLKIDINGGLPFDPALDASATLSADGKTVALFVVNSTNQPQKRTVHLPPLGKFKREVRVWTVADTAQAGERDAVNSWHEPERIRTLPGKAKLDGAKLVYEFPALSLTVLEFRR